MVYSTCSLEPEKNEEVIAAVLAQNPSARVVPLGAVLEALRDGGIVTLGGAEKLPGFMTSEGFLRLIPGALGTDGFFVAMLGTTG